VTWSGTNTPTTFTVTFDLDGMQIALANGTWVPSNDPLMQNDTFTFGGVIEPLVNFPPAPPGDLIMAGKGTISQVMGDGTLVFSGTFTVVPEPMSMMFLGIGLAGIALRLHRQTQPVHRL
jgi:hypothetical protein